MYTWDLEKMEEEKKRLENIRKTKRKKISNRTLERLNYSITMYDFLLSFFDAKEEETELDEEISDKTFVARYFSNIYKDINKDIIRATVGSSYIFENSDIDDCLGDDSLNMISLFDTIKITKDIFSSFNNKEIMDKVEEFLKPENHLLHIYCKNDIESLNTDYSGYSSCDYYNKIGYAIIYSNGKIRDLYTLVHEIFHVIISENKSPNFFTDDNYFFSEIEGAFADLIVTDYLFNHGILEEDSVNIEWLNYTNSRTFIRNLYISNSFYNRFNENDKFDIKKINEEIENSGFKYNIDNRLMRSSLFSFSRDLCYGFSFLIALDLFYKYKNGYKDIIGDLKEIAASKRPFILLDRYDVSFYKDGYKNLDDYQKILSKKIKR